MKKQNFENYKLDLVDNKKFYSISEFEFVKDPRKNKTQLGVGSFGEVKLAVHKKTGVKYAIKIMNLKNMNSVQEIQGIEREVRVHSVLKHPNIIEYHDSFQESELVFIVLDFASNGNLYSLLYKKRTFSEKEAYRFFSQTCEAIKYLHSINIVHRDLKPENILLDEEFNIKVCDFGWCTEDIENPRNTFCGTYEYMAPEIVFRQPYDYRIDIWALGVLIYELLHGCAPFKGKTFKEIQRKIEKGDVQFSESISDYSKQLICKVLQANPARRISIEDIMSHPWMYKMRSSEREEKKSEQTKSSTNITKNQSNNNNLKVDENDQPKVKEMQQLQKKLDNRSQSPIIGANQKQLPNEIKNDKENIAQTGYASICNAELSERKKNNTPNKTTASIPKKENEGLLVNQRKLFSNSKSSNQVGQSIEFPKIILTEPQTSEVQQFQKEVLSGKKTKQQEVNDANQQIEGLKDKFNDYNTQNQQQQQQQQQESKRPKNMKSMTPTNSSSQNQNENPFKNIDHKDLAQINNIAKKQQEMMKLNFQTQQQQQQYNLQNENIPQPEQVKQNMITETAYSKDIDENSIKNSQKTINTSRFVNKHGSIHGNSLQQPHPSVSSQGNFMSKGINVSQAFNQNQFFNQTDEIKFHNEINVNHSYTKTEGNSYIGNSYLGNRNNPNTSITQDEPCFSLFGCLGPSHISTTQRNRDNSNSNAQKMQAKQILNNHLPNGNQHATHHQSTNSAYSSFTNQGENRPRINSTNAASNQSFLKQQSSTPINNQSIISNSQQYSTHIQQNSNNIDKNSFSTQRSSNSFSNKVSNHSFLGQQNNSSSTSNNQFQTNSRISSNYIQQMQQQQQQQSKLPLGDKTNLPVSAIPTKQINLQDERKNLQKLQTSINPKQEQLQQAISQNNNSYISNLPLTKERSLTQDCQSLQQQYSNMMQGNSNSSSHFNQQKINIQTQNNNNSNTSFSNLKLESSKSGNQSNHDVNRINRTGQRSRTLIFEELNTEKTKNVMESMEQMISFVRNALPFSSTSQNQNFQNATPLSNNHNHLGNFQDQQSINDISTYANISILQNTSIQKVNSADSSQTPTYCNKQSNSSKQIININNLKSQRIEQLNNNESSKSQQQLTRNNGQNSVHSNSGSSHRNKQKIFDGKGSQNASSFHSNHTPMQSISNLNNVSVNNYFTQKTSPNLHSYSNIPPHTQLGKQQSFNLNDCSLNKLSLHNNNNQNSLYFQ